MMRPSTSVAVLAVMVLAMISVRLPAQTVPPAQTPPAQTPQTPQTPPAGPGQGGRGGRGLETFPAQQRPPADPAVLARGKGLYDVYCRSCHGADLRGGDQGGPNLLRSPVALNDADGESIGPVVKQGRQTPGMPIMPALPLPDDDVKAVSAYVRSVLATASRQGGPPAGPPVVLNILVGDAAAGQRYFAAKCSACHSPTGDLKGFAAKVADATQLQNTWVSGGGRGGRGGAAGPPPASRAVMATVTTPDGQRVEGRLVRMDDFIVVIANTDGQQRSFRREGDVPRIQVRDPLEGHQKLLLEYTDKDIHDVTAYLATLK
jgi:cytochrome c oxidase cbb3-type subunit 3